MAAVGVNILNNDWLKGKEYTKYLRVLGLDQNCTLDELRRTHRSLVYKWHPDRFQYNDPQRGFAEEKIKVINTAYDTLKKMNLDASSQAANSDDWCVLAPKTCQDKHRAKLDRLCTKVELQLSP